MHNTDALRASLFKVAGRMITASIVNGCPGFPCLSPAVYAYLISNSCQGVDIVKEDIVDLEIRQVLSLVRIVSVVTIYNMLKSYTCLNSCSLFAMQSFFFAVKGLGKSV